MKENIKLIKRYLAVYRNHTIAVGSYYGSSSITITAKFNITLESIQLGTRVYDSVTSQSVDSFSFVDFSLQTPNPALDTSGTVTNPTVSCFNGQEAKLELCYNMSAGEVITMACQTHLNAVTANSFIAWYKFLVGYLCPEDYLSVDGFAAIPG